MDRGRRMLVNAMTQDADVRGKATVVTSAESYALASELITALRAREAAEGEEDGGAVEEGEEEDSTLE